MAFIVNVAVVVAAVLIVIVCCLKIRDYLRRAAWERFDRDVKKYVEHAWRPGAGIFPSSPSDPKSPTEPKFPRP
jgi:hypothetical protein